MINKGTFRLLLATTIACLAFTGVHAGGYVGAAAGQGSTQIQPDPTFTAFDGSGTAYKVLGGWRVIKFFGIEADYRDFGTQEDEILGQGVQVETTALDLFAVGVIPIGSWELFGKAGYSRWDAEISAVGVPGGVSDDGTDIAYGVGVAYTFSKVGLRLEYEEFDVEDVDQVNMFSFGFDFRF
jgi:hypothetical protein